MPDLLKKAKKVNLVSWHTHQVNQMLNKNLVSCHTKYDYIEYKLKSYTTELAEKDKDQLKDLGKENNSEDISEDLYRKDKDVFNVEVKTKEIKIKMKDKPEESPETFEHVSNDIIQNVKKSHIDKLQRKDKEGKSKKPQERLEQETNESLEEREKSDITESEEVAESEEGEGKSDIVEDELKESLQKIKTYLKKWKKKLTKEI